MEKSVEIRTERGIMRGMLHLPDGPVAPFPAVVVFHGFEGNRMGSSSFFVTLSRSLCLAGYACVRFDFLGSGESEGEFSETTITREVENAIAILKWTILQPGIDPARVALLGHSLGASITAILAGELEIGEVSIEGAGLRALVLLAPAGEIRDRIDEELEARGLRMKVGSPEFEKLPFPVPVRGGLLDKGFFDDLKRYGVMDRAAQSSKPCLVVQGDADHMVPPRVCEEFSRRMKDCELRMIRGTGHNFNDPIARAKVASLVIAHLDRNL